jgi:hypothetical protein
MNDVQRHRKDASECLSAAERCGLPYRGLTLASAGSWLSPARQQEAMDQLLAILSKAKSDTAVTAPSRQPFQYPREPHRPPFAGAARFLHYERSNQFPSNA